MAADGGSLQDWQLSWWSECQFDAVWPWFYLVGSVFKYAGSVKCTDCGAACDEADIRRIVVLSRDPDGNIKQYRVQCWRCVVAAPEVS